MQNCRNLWAAVMERAFLDLDLPQNTAENVEAKASAIRWFKNKRNKELGSFLWCCDLLGHTPKETRAIAFKKIKEAA